MKALVVDDSSTMRSMLGMLLDGIGFEIIEAGDGVEALARLRENDRFAVMLVDWNMPNMSGIEFLAEVRADNAYDDVPVMMVTTEGELGNVMEALETGANEYIMKPFSHEALMEKLAILGFNTDASATT